MPDPALIPRAAHRRGDVDGPRARRNEPVEGGGGGVAQHRGGAGGQDSRHPPPADRERGLTDRVDAVAFAVKGAARLPARDARGAEPEGKQLSMREHSVLPRGHRGDASIERGVLAASPRVIPRA